MAIAGRVAIVPKGEYSNAVTYDKLDLVMFNNDAYVAKKASTGIEPTNDEYWMLILNNVVAEDLENIINGTTPVSNALKLGGKGASEYALVSDRYTSLSGYSSILEWALANPDSVAQYSGNGFEDCPFNKDHWGLVWNIATNTSSSAYGITVYARGNNGAIVYQRGIVNGAWSYDWKNSADGGNADTVDGYHAFALMKNMGSNPTDFTITQSARITSNADGKFPFNYGSYVAFSSAPQSSSGKYVLHLYASNGKLYWQKTESGDIVADKWTQAVVTSDLAKYLPLDGSVPMSGYFLYLFNKYGAIYTDTNKTTVNSYNSNTDITNARSLMVLNSNQVADVGKSFIARDVVNGTATDHTVLHTGNKPTGSYTGNGSATSRTINTGGIGSELLFRCGGEVGLFSRYGGFVVNFGMKQIFYFTAEEMKFENGVLTLATDSVYVNDSGGSYEYRVL